MMLLQDLVHKIETAGSSRYLRYALGVLAVVLVLVAYDLRAYRNMAAPEAMDAAQLARNISQGKGFTTDFVRPFSMFLVKRVNERPGVPDPSRIKTAHPDIANPPVYPLILAGYMKVAPFKYSIANAKAFWINGGRIRYQPDFLIALFNQLLFMGLIVAVFFWARRLFDNAVAWTSALLLFGTELLWRFSASGLSTMLLLLIFMGLIWCLTLLESEAREPKRGPVWLLIFAGAAGLAVGVACLTRYSMGWLIIPVVVFLILFSGPRRISVSLTVLAVFFLVISPWMVRNYRLSGVPFGIATYSVLESSPIFSDTKLERSLNPDFSKIARLTPFWAKFTVNIKSILQNDILRLGGGWISAFFLVGLLVGFRSPALRRLRYFAMFSLVTFVFVQAVGQTQLSQETPEVNSENLLVVLTPMVLVFGVALFFLLLDQIATPVILIRYVVIGLFCVLLCLPLAFSIFSKANPVAYPPYYPPQIQEIANMMTERELIMSDIPWAVAWYGDRQSVWLTLNAVRDPRDPHSQENFLTINDYQKQINALYLTAETIDSKFLTQWVEAGEQNWGSFIVDTLLRKEVPLTFPLHQMPVGYAPRAIFICDWVRWRKSERP
jgi:4-amino-4-deoxy-L-arabinose transferase-like glycosyltransferase